MKREGGAVPLFCHGEYEIVTNAKGSFIWALGWGIFKTMKKSSLPKLADSLLYYIHGRKGLGVVQTQSISRFHFKEAMGLVISNLHMV